ncbi:MAG: hypothetical protein ACJARI_002781 [Bacteroidia bacterium]|jgi:hypothetical protein
MRQWVITPLFELKVRGLKGLLWLRLDSNATALQVQWGR